jgi:hypothetical protein
MKNHSLITAAIVSTFVLAGATSVLAQQDAAGIYGDASGPVNYNNTSGAYPVVTSVLSVPGVTINGYTYSASSGTFLAADSSGSVEIYDTPVGTYVPTLGDGIDVTGTASPFDGIPEIKVAATGTVTLESSGNAAPAGIGTLASPTTTTISAINTGANPVQSIAAQVLQLDDVTISGQTVGETFGTADLTLSISDGVNSMTFFYYPHDFSVANQNLFGETIPTTPVDMVGLVDFFSPNNEFLGLQIIPVPEPTTLALCGAGALLTLVVFRQRKQA